MNKNHTCRISGQVKNYIDAQNQLTMNHTTHKVELYIYLPKLLNIADREDRKGRIKHRVGRASTY